MKAFGFSSSPEVCLICDCILDNMTDKNKKNYFCKLKERNADDELYGPLCKECQEYLADAGRIEIHS